MLFKFFFIKKFKFVSKFLKSMKNNKLFYSYIQFLSIFYWNSENLI